MMPVKYHYHLRFWIAVLAVLTVMLSILACMIGVANISMTDTIQILLNRLPFLHSVVPLPDHITQNAVFIVMEIRLPRICMALLSGAVLSVCGAVFQSIFQNPLSDPYTLGVSSGGSLGAAIAIVLGLENLYFGVGGFAFVGAMLTIYVISRIAAMGNRIHTPTLLLSGVAITFFCSATLMLLMILNQEQMGKILFWTMGSLAAVTLHDIAWIAPVLILALIWIGTYAKSLNILQMGNENARNLGINTAKMTKLLLAICTFIIAIIVAKCGVIGFVGLVIPHIVRLVVGADNRKIIPLSVFCGAIFMLVTDSLCRMVLSTGELPVGSVTAFIGAPFFIVLLFRAKRKQAS